jgi:hypothetical protein
VAPGVYDVMSIWSRWLFNSVWHGGIGCLGGGGLDNNMLLCLFVFYDYLS